MADTVAFIGSVNITPEAAQVVEVMLVAYPATLSWGQSGVIVKVLVDFSLNASQFNTALRTAVQNAVTAAGFPFVGGDRLVLLGGAL